MFSLNLDPLEMKLVFPNYILSKNNNRRGESGFKSLPKYSGKGVREGIRYNCIHDWLLTI